MPKEELNLKTIQGVEIFSAGTWNDDTYTVDDLDEMVRAYHDNSLTLRPPLKLGHDDDQKILQQDGYPAAGWVGNLYRKGEKLLADFVDIPEKIYELIERGGYRKVSSELYWEAEVNGVLYKRLLGAVALLGADIPAVSNLRDMLALYAQSNVSKKMFYTEAKGAPTIKTYSFSKGGNQVTEEEIKLQKELDAEKAKALALEGKIAEFTAAQSEKDAEIEAFKTYKAEIEAKLLESAQKEKDAILESEVSNLVATKVISPAMKPFVKSLIGDEKKTYSLKIGDKDKEFSKLDLFKEIFSLQSEALKLNTNEKTINGDIIRQGDVSDEELNKYVSDNECSYGEAYRALFHGKLVQKKD